jgi:predicted membrane channel-forming protein YqfA (hemolysin III family)
MPYGLIWIPITTISLAISLGGLGALVKRTWESEKEPASYKIALTILIGTIMLLVMRILWYLNQLLFETLF